jgi:hypothetical protein
VAFAWRLIHDILALKAQSNIVNKAKYFSFYLSISSYCLLVRSPHCARRVKAFVRTTSEEVKARVETLMDTIVTLGSLSQLAILFNEPAPTGCAVHIVDPTCELYLELKGTVDVNAETARLEKLISTKKNEIEQLRKRSFAPGVPKEIQEKNAQRVHTHTLSLPPSPSPSAPLSVESIGKIVQIAGIQEEIKRAENALKMLREIK